MIFRKKSERREQHNEKMRGGEGTVTVRHLLEADELAGKGRLFAEITVPAGASIGLHKHEGESETFYILNGSGTYHNNETSWIVNPGDTVTVADGDSHSVVNTGSGELVMVALILYA